MRGQPRRLLAQVARKSRCLDTRHPPAPFRNQLRLYSASAATPDTPDTLLSA